MDANESDHFPPDLRALGLEWAEVAPFPVAAVEEAGHTIRYANPAFSEWMGVLASHVINTAICEVLPGDHSCIELLHRVILTRKPGSYSPGNDDESGRTYMMWPLTGEDGLIGVIVQGPRIVAPQDILVELNRALVIGSVRQHELKTAADDFNVLLQSEIAERQRLQIELQDAHNLMSRHAENLEMEVSARTASLRQMNEDLIESVRVIQLAKEDYQKLFEKSELMQVELRKLTRQFLAAQEAERQSISRALHDEILQTLLGINMDLARLEKMSLDPQAMELILRVGSFIQASVKSVHQFAKDLRPAVLDDIGLVPALESYLKDFKGRTGINVAFTTNSVIEKLGIPERTALFRVVQEALTNIHRHANTKKAWLTMKWVGETVDLKILDRGSGFSPKPLSKEKASSRLGLLGMKERIEMIGGTLMIDSIPGEFTCVSVTVRVAERQARTHEGPSE